MSQETINTIALTRIGYFSSPGLLDLYRRAGSATAVIDNRNHIRDILPDASDHLIEGLKNSENAVKQAEEELEYDERHGIKALCFNDNDYPQRMRECPDAPLVLYRMGNANLNKRHIVNIVGTRHCTNYGQDIIRTFTKELRTLCPDVLIVSGLAYGVDICAHRSALENGFDTVAVLAHGFDTIYPSSHRETALRMLENGGLLTEYTISTKPKAQNFVQRNRIVAGCSDATILVESASKGGGLITCGIARSYNRDVFAFPGNIGAEYSEGCNTIIRDNGASLITSAIDFVKAMGWGDDLLLEKSLQQGIERTLFPDLSADEQTVVDVLQKNNDLQINLLSVQTGLPISRLTALLFELEMKGVVKALAGGSYHLLM